MVVMEHLSDSCDWDDSHRTSEAAAITMLHDHGYVHGDLRNANILRCPDSVVKIIDFDWCGVEGSACYPMDKNDAAAREWHVGATRGTLITRENRKSTSLNSRY